MSWCGAVSPACRLIGLAPCPTEAGAPPRGSPPPSRWVVSQRRMLKSGGCPQGAAKRHPARAASRWGGGGEYICQMKALLTRLQTASQVVQ
eukprot:8613448-Pyramimonas_sp.AAC.1